VDADTLDLEVELGLEVYTRTRVRLADIDAWEVRGPERPRGQLASQFAQTWLDESQSLEIRAGDSRGYKRGKYGRWIVYICRPDAECLNDVLVTEGHAERSDG
jgi:endonuclease YncB( thermonuclease family)